MKTPVIRYYLDNQKSKTPDKRVTKELIMVEVNYGYASYDNKSSKRYKPFRISLDASVMPNKFGLISKNFKFDESVFKRNSKNNSAIKTKMGHIESAVNALHNNYEVARIMPTPSKFKNDLQIELGRVKKIEEQEKLLLDYIYENINKSEADSELGKRNSISTNTIKTYKTVSHMVENYQIATKEILTFQNFDEHKYWKFWEIQDEILKDNIKVENPNQQGKKSKQEYGYLKNSLRKYQSTLIRILKDAVKDKTEISINAYDENLILKKVKSSKDIYVTEIELQKIIDVDVHFDDELQMAKDYMIIGSLTGMRYESMYDTMKTKVERYNEGKQNFEYIHSKQNKTSTEVFIPLLALVKDVLSKCENKFPVVKSNPVINKALKKLFKFLEIDSLEYITRNTYRSGIIKIEKPKYEIVSTHDCKKTFYTNLYNNNVNPIAIDNITHPDTATKNRMAKVYNKSTMLDKAKMFVDEIKKIESEIYKF